MAGDAEQLGQVHVEKAQKGLSLRSEGKSLSSRRLQLNFLCRFLPTSLCEEGERALPEGDPPVPAGPSLALPHRSQSEARAEQGKVPGQPRSL